jgi:hypothetical protein
VPLASETGVDVADGSSTAVGASAGSSTGVGVAVGVEAPPQAATRKTVKKSTTYTVL